MGPSLVTTSARLLFTFKAEPEYRRGNCDQANATQDDQTANKHRKCWAFPKENNAPK